MVTGEFLKKGLGVMNDCKVQWMKYWIQSWTLHYDLLDKDDLRIFISWIFFLLLLKRMEGVFLFRKGSRHFTKLFFVVISLSAERIICVICHAFISEYINDTNEWPQLSQFYCNSLFSLPPTLFQIITVTLTPD